MSQISRIKGYDKYGYEVMEFQLPTVDEATQNAIALAQAIGNVGVSAEEAAENIRSVAYLLNENCSVKNELADTYGRIQGTEAVLSCDIRDLKEEIAALKREIDLLRSETSAKTETPKQKSDLEIFSRIIPDEEFLKISDGNIFLN